MLFKCVYEFWGFCVNGTDNLKVPGGFATSQTTGSYINQAVGFESGSTVLLVSGSDGQTTFGTSIFSVPRSIPFAPTMVGKHLVLWKSGSKSTDDSIYLIKRWINSSSILVDCTSGGTPIGPSGSAPSFTTRSNINYRVIDLVACRTLSGYVPGMHMVLQFNGAADVNPGQALSQFKLTYRPELISNGDPIGCLHLTLSPSGSWDGGSVFVNENYPEFGPETSNSGPGSGGWAGESWFHGVNGNLPLILTLIGDNTALNCFLGGPALGSDEPGWASVFNVEIPQRLYPANVDPNLICGCNIGNLGINSYAQRGWNYSGRVFPSPYDTLLRRWPISVRGFTGTYWNSQMWGGNNYGLATARWGNTYYNVIQNKFLMPDVIIGMSTVNGQASAAGQFSMARARIRSARYIPGGYPQYMRVGDNDDKWIHVGNGVMWPWDHSLVAGRGLFESA